MRLSKLAVPLWVTGFVFLLLPVPRMTSLRMWLALCFLIVYGAVARKVIVSWRKQESN